MKLLNDECRNYIPHKILDDTGVRYIKEVEDLGSYGEGMCECGSHPLEADTWYHKPLVLTADGKNIGVYRACKKCRVVLIREIKKG